MQSLYNECDVSTVAIFRNVQQGTASPAEEKDEEVDVGEEEQLSMDTGYHDVSYQNNNEEQIEEEEDFVDVDDSVPAATPRYVYCRVVMYQKMCM